LNTFIRSANADVLCKTTWLGSEVYQHADSCIWALGTGYIAQYKACLDTLAADTDFAPTGDAANYKALLTAQIACYATVNAVATSDCAAKTVTPSGESDGEDDGESSSLLTFSAMLLLVLSALLF